MPATFAFFKVQSEIPDGFVFKPGVFVFSPSLDPPSPSFQIQFFPPQPTFTAFVAFWNQRIQQEPQCRIFQSAELSLLGRTAHRVTYSAQHGVSTRFTDIFFLHLGQSFARLALVGTFEQAQTVREVWNQTLQSLVPAPFIPATEHRTSATQNTFSGFGLTCTLPDGWADQTTYTFGSTQSPDVELEIKADEQAYEETAKEKVDDFLVRMSGLLENKSQTTDYGHWPSNSINGFQAKVHYWEAAIPFLCHFAAFRPTQKTGFTMCATGPKEAFASLPDVHFSPITP
ncbi:MAG: hypothetical protein JNN12_01930 [Bacteroidetes Order II. Incertae sedis bacterium]|nr:hypothetical protein [Bacteroidetes Order II. bacterium]